MARSSATHRAVARGAAVTLVVYAPLGGDETLSRYPDDRRRLVSEHPMVRNLQAVARGGVNVIALIDHSDHATWLMELPANQTTITWTSAWGEDMASPATLMGLLMRARSRWPKARLVLSLEGHGAGFWPDLDRRQFTARRLTGDGAFRWELDAGSARVRGGRPPITMGAPMLTMGAPMLPGASDVLSTPGLHKALRGGLAALPQMGLPGVKLDVVHLNNCHNMALEVLLAVAPHARWAVGYMNYNFYSAGEGCKEAFAAWGAMAPTLRTPQSLARAFAAGNKTALQRSRRDHPTVASVVDCKRVPLIARDTESLGTALAHWLAGSDDAVSRPARVEAVRSAIRAAQQYDTRAHGGEGVLEVPDELTDLLSFASALGRTGGIAGRVRSQAASLGATLAGLKAYGDVGEPWVWPEQRWDFSSAQLAMSILCPDPLREGLWDWRSPYYLVPADAPGEPPLQPLRLPWLARRNGWVDFIVEYHRDVPFRGIREAPRLFYPTWEQ